MKAWNALKKLLTHPEDSRDRQRIAIALAKGGAMRQARAVNPVDPASWEFSGFSQNGEDGVLDVLRGRLTASNRCFVEIGSGDGVENNTAWLLVAEKYAGLMVEGDPWLARRTRRNITPLSIGCDCRSLFVTRNSVEQVRALAPCADPDVFSLDIDGNDYHIMKAAFDAGFRPRIIVVEYNAVFGPERRLTIEYQSNFMLADADPRRLRYGVSIAGWRSLMDSQGYRFVTVERCGVNAFFVDPAWFAPAFLDGVRGLAFAENRYQKWKFGMPAERQFELIAGLPYLEL